MATSGAAKEATQLKTERTATASERTGPRATEEEDPTALGANLPTLAEEDLSQTTLATLVSLASQALAAANALLNADPSVDATPDLTSATLTPSDPMAAAGNLPDTTDVNPEDAELNSSASSTL